MARKKSYRVKGDVVRDLREGQFMSQDELAAKADVSESTIRRMENENRSPHRANVRKVADALGVEPGALIEFEDPELHNRLRRLAVA